MHVPQRFGSLENRFVVVLLIAGDDVARVRVREEDCSNERRRPVSRFFPRRSTSLSLDRRADARKRRKETELTHLTERMHVQERIDPVEHIVPQGLQLDRLERLRARVRVGARVWPRARLELVAPVPVQVDSEALFFVVVFGEGGRDVVVGGGVGGGGGGGGGAGLRGLAADWLARLAPKAVVLPGVDVSIRLSRTQ